MKSASGSIQVNERQRGNPILRDIRNVPWEFARDIIPDYVVGNSAAVLFLSLKYHMLHAMYIQKRIKELSRDFQLRIVLVCVDTEDNSKSLLELNKLCFSNNFTLLLAWSCLEAARYIETLKAYESKSASTIQERLETEFLPKVSTVLTTIKPVNKTDVVTLVDTFGSLKGICNAAEQQLMVCPGLGEKKVKRLYAALHEPFQKYKRRIATVEANLLGHDIILDTVDQSLVESNDATVE